MIITFIIKTEKDMPEIGLKFDAGLKDMMRNLTVCINLTWWEEYTVACVCNLTVVFISSLIQIRDRPQNNRLLIAENFVVVLLPKKSDKVCSC